MFNQADIFASRMQKLKTQSVDGAADIAREMEGRQDRANNIVMFNAPESSAGSRVEQQGDDRNVFKTICVNLGAYNAQIITRRLRKKIETETRPIRVEITDLDNKKTILKKECVHSKRSNPPAKGNNKMSSDGGGRPC